MKKLIQPSATSASSIRRTEPLKKKSEPTPEQARAARAREKAWNRRANAYMEDRAQFWKSFQQAKQATRLKTRPPDHCKVPRQVCLDCKVAKCDQRSSWYTTKVCYACQTAKRLAEIRRQREIRRVCKKLGL